MPGAGTPSPEPKTADFLKLYEEAVPAIYAWARLHILPPLRRRLDVDDVVQEVCYRAYARFDRFDPERGPFRAWLFGFAHNVLRESLRRFSKMRGESVFHDPASSREPGIDAVAAEATTITSRLARAENLQGFLEQIETLEGDDRRLLLYRGLEGRKHKEVADVLGISVENAEKKWQRLRSRLQKEGAPAGLLCTG